MLGGFAVRILLALAAFDLLAATFALLVLEWVPGTVALLVAAAILGLVARTAHRNEW